MTSHYVCNVAPEQTAMPTLNAELLNEALALLAGGYPVQNGYEEQPLGSPVWNFDRPGCTPQPPVVPVQNGVLCPAPLVQNGYEETALPTPVWNFEMRNQAPVAQQPQVQPVQNANEETPLPSPVWNW